MLILRVNGESYKDDLIFSIDYKDLYKEFNDKYNYMFMSTDVPCLLDMLGILVKDNNLFFSYTEYDDMLDEDRENNREDYFLSNHKNGYKHITEEIKEILIKHYKNKIVQPEDIEVLKDSLLNELKNTPADKIEKDLVEDIKDFIYKKYVKKAISDYSQEVQDFVNKRISTIMYDYGFPYINRLVCEEKPIDFIRELWMKMESKKDIEYWVKNMYTSFLCAVNTTNSVEDYDSLMLYEWGWIDDNELLLLDVWERNKGEFINKILPLLERELGFEIMVVDDINKVLG